MKPVCKPGSTARIDAAQDVQPGTIPDQRVQHGAGQPGASVDDRTPDHSNEDENFDEVLRVLESMQLTAKHKVATPVNWKQGEDVIIVPAVSDEEAKEKFPGGWKAPKPYLRLVPQPE